MPCSVTIHRHLQVVREVWGHPFPTQSTFLETEIVHRYYPPVISLIVKARDYIDHSWRQALLQNLFPQMTTGWLAVIFPPLASSDDINTDPLNPLLSAYVYYWRNYRYPLLLKSRTLKRPALDWFQDYWLSRDWPLQFFSVTVSYYTVSQSSVYCFTQGRFLSHLPRIR